MSWRVFADAAPELAAFGLGRLHDQVAYFATVRPDGSPRLDPVRPVVTKSAVVCSRWVPKKPIRPSRSAVATPSSP